MSDKYDSYIASHKDGVQRAFEWLRSHKIIPRELLLSVQITIASHDNSKYSKQEYTPYDNYFNGPEKTEEIKIAFNYAWLHHIHNNSHHWQHWVLINDEEGTHALEMPEKYVYEMICDWWSFSFRKGDLKEIFKWYKDHKSNMILHPDTQALVESILDSIKKELEAHN